MLTCHASKIMLKILQARLQQYVNQELPDVQTQFIKGRGTRDQIANIWWIIEKARELKKKKSASLTTRKPLTMWITVEQWNILNEMGILDHMVCLLRNLYAGQEQQLELDMEQCTGSKLGKEYVKAVYCHPAYLTYMKSTS